MKTEVETVWQGDASAVVQTGGSDVPYGGVFLVVCENAQDDGAGVVLSAEKARALAALLLKHADRAEGKPG